MKEILTYALGVVVCSGLFTAFYRTVLHRHTSFRVARIYLVASLVVAAVIPALDIPVWRVAPMEATLVTTMPLDFIDFAGTPVAAPPVDWGRVALWALWTVGIGVLAVVMTCQIVRIARIKRRAEVFRATGCEIALSGEVSSPFSFMRTVFVERGTNDEEMRQIVLHEASHIRHRHSQEKIAMEAIKNLQWFNPFAWWAASLLGEVHEFEADRDVLDGGFTVEEYLPLIFRQIFGYNPELSVGLGDSLTKKRFLMMKNKMKLTRYSALRVAGVLPLAAGMMMLFSFTERAPEIIYTESPEAVEAPVVTPEPPESSMLEAAVVHQDGDNSVDIVESYTAPSASAQSPQKPDGDTPVPTAEVMPKFEGGNLNDFRYWVQSRLIYPKEAVEKNIVGKVTLRFVIERDGSLTNIEEIASPSKLLTDEVVRVISQSPKWSSGMQKGKPVRVFYIMPVDFSLQGNTDESAKNEATTLTVKGTGTAGDGQQPLYFLDGKEITGEQLPLDPNTIKSIDVLKDASAVEKYGERAKVGAVLITSKSGTGESNIPDDVLKGKMEEIRVIGYGVQRHDTEKPRIYESIHLGLTDKETGDEMSMSGNPMILLDGKEITNEEMKAIDQNTIESIAVLKDRTAIDLYGEKGKNGVILIKTRKAQAPESTSVPAVSKEYETGYGKVPGRINTTSITQLDMAGSYSYSDLKSYIQGRVPGVRFLGDNLIIRGINSINSSIDALVVVDGVAVSSFADANAMIAPSDVASISVLKDAGATGIYGMRGSNGVVLITTKKGSNG